MDKPELYDDNGFPIPISVEYDAELSSVIDAFQKLIDHRNEINPATIGYNTIESRKDNT